MGGYEVLKQFFARRSSSKNRSGLTYEDIEFIMEELWVETIFDKLEM